MSRDALLASWSSWNEAKAPFILEEDRSVLESERSTRAIKVITSWQSAYQSDDFSEPGDTKLHLGLLPHPFCGDLRNAEVYILLLNPGFGPHDYYAEYEVPRYRQIVLANLKQEFSPETLPFYHLDPQFSWHGGFTWWHGKLARVIQQLAHTRGVSFAEARSELGKKIASIELLPYHSSSFRDGGGWVRQLHSVKLAYGFVHDYILPRVESGDAIVIVTRQASVWNLPERKGIIRYSGQEARAAHLSPVSLGGRAILGHLNRNK